MALTAFLASVMKTISVFHVKQRNKANNIHAQLIIAGYASVDSSVLGVYLRYY